MMKDYSEIIEYLRAHCSFFLESSVIWPGTCAQMAADAIEELIDENKRLTEENKELCYRIDYCTRTATGTEDLDKMWERFDELLDSLGKMEE